MFNCDILHGGRMAEESALIDGWNGTAWSLQENPTGAEGETLFGVYCAEAAACFGLGDVFISGHYKPLSLRFAE